MSRSQILLLRAMLCVVSILRAVPDVRAAGASNPDSRPRVTRLEIGLDGKYKVGFWTPVWVTIVAGEKPFRGEVELVVPDGDGVQTCFANGDDRPIEIVAHNQARILRYVKFGRIRTSVAVRFVGRSGAVYQQPFSTDQIPTAGLSTSELLVSFGGDIGLEKALQLQRHRITAETTTRMCVIQSARDLPDHWIGYDSVDLLVITTSDMEPVREMTRQQVEAIETWVRMGGRLILCVGANGREVLGTGGPLTPFAPGQFEGVQPLKRTVHLETYAKATQRLDTLSGAAQLQMTSLRDVRGRIESPETNVRDQGPTVVRTALGLGQVVFVAMDLDQPPLSQWQGQPRLVARLLRQESPSQEEDDHQQRVGKVAHEGYDEMIGQLRVAMDQFTGVTLVSFTLVATLTVLYIVLIGPADYFLLSKLIGRMEWTWVTFPVSVLLFCLLAFCLVYVCQSRQLRINQVELVDVDAESSLVRGTVWAHLYSPKTDTYGLAFQPDLPHGMEATSALLSWHGLPGEGLGGMSTRTTAELFSEPYWIFSRRGPLESLTTTIFRMPVQPSSSKTLGVRWWGRVTKEISSQLRVDRRNDSLRGQFTNPLNVELTDCILTYGHWTYRLDRKLGPHERIDVYDQMLERSLDMYLTRRSVEDRTTDWDLASANIPRIVEIMMYHSAARGQVYTGLSHRYQAYTDLSSHLHLDRAMLTGWTAKRAGQLTRDSQPLANHYDQTWTFYRIVFPIERSMEP